MFLFSSGTDLMYKFTLEHLKYKFSHVCVKFKAIMFSLWVLYKGDTYSSANQGMFVFNLKLLLLVSV